MKYLILLVLLVMTFQTLDNPCPECPNGCVVTGGTCNANIVYVKDKYGNDHMIGGDCHDRYYCK